MLCRLLITTHIWACNNFKNININSKEAQKITISVISNKATNITWCWKWKADTSMYLKYNKVSRKKMTNVERIKQAFSQAAVEAVKAEL